MEGSENQYIYPTAFCKNCGAPLTEDQAFCPKCGTPRMAENKRICRNCGAELMEDQYFCPKCGTKFDPNTPVPLGPAVNAAGQGTREQGTKKKKTWILIPIIAGAALVALGIALFFILRGVQVSDVSLSKDSLTLKEGETSRLVCTVSPDNAKDKTLTWESSNKSVARVDTNGKVTAVKEGTCTITVRASNGKSDECRVVIEKAGPDFKAIYRDYCSSTWASVGSDGSYLSVDTNPRDKDDYIEYSAYYALYSIHEALGLPESLIEDMGKTTALMGKQTETYTSIGITVTWTYHPDKGLEITYKSINK